MELDTDLNQGRVMYKLILLKGQNGHAQVVKN